jgi:hypothetical protein
MAPGARAPDSSARRWWAVSAKAEKTGMGKARSAALTDPVPRMSSGGGFPLAGALSAMINAAAWQNTVNVSGSSRARKIGAQA